MKDEIFDRKIKELADSYSEVPSPDLWERIESGLDRRRRVVRWRRIVSYASAAAVVAGLFVTSLLYQPDPDPADAVDVLAKVGGLDIAGLAGVFLGGAICHIPIIIDGFISSAAALCAARIAPDCGDYMMPSHRSNEPAGGMVLEALGLSPLIDCGMSLGEGSGAVAVLPLFEMGLEVYNRMSTFEEIKVEQYEELN